MKILSVLTLLFAIPMAKAQVTDMQSLFDLAADAFNANGNELYQSEIRKNFGIDKSILEIVTSASESDCRYRGYGNEWIVTLVETQFPKVTVEMKYVEPDKARGIVVVSKLNNRTKFLGFVKSKNDCNLMDQPVFNQ